MKSPLTVLAGIGIAGVLLGFALATFMVPSGNTVKRGTIAGEVSAKEGADQSQDPGLQTAALEAEIRALRAKVQALSGGVSEGERTLARPETEGEDQHAELDAESLNLLEAVIADYQSMDFVAALKARAMKDSAASVARSLYNDYINAERPRDAERVLQLMERLAPDITPGAWELTNLASLYLRLGDRGRAAALYARALRMEPHNTDFASQLAALDPAAGIALLLEANADGKLLEDASGRYNMALLLMKSGDMEGALAALHAPDGSIDSAGWDLFFENAPERALGELIEAAKDDPYGRLSLRLAQYYAEAEQPEEAIRELEALLKRSPENTDALAQLAELAPERGLALLEARLQSSPSSPDVWQRYAEQLRSLGRMDEAVEAGLEAFRLGNATWPEDYLLEAAPEEVLHEFENRVTGSLDDELWGDYGDTLWRAGHPDEALSAWEKARGIDSEDGEWIGKVNAIKAGKSPFGESQGEPDFSDSVPTPSNDEFVIFE